LTYAVVFQSTASKCSSVTPAASHAMIVNKLLVRTIEAARAAPSQREPEAAVASAVGGTGSDVVGCLSGGGGGVGAIGCRRARRPRRSQSRRMKIRTWGLCNFRGQVSSYLSALACFFLYAAPPVVRRSTAPMLHTSGREPLKDTHTAHIPLRFSFTHPHNTPPHSPHVHHLLLFHFQSARSGDLNRRLQLVHLRRAVLLEPG